jgi:hypothetical protein
MLSSSGNQQNYSLTFAACISYSELRESVTNSRLCKEPWVCKIANQGCHMNTKALGSQSIVSPAPGQLSSKLGDEMVILHLESGVYYGLDTVGARIWELAQQSRTVGEIRDQIVSEFDVAPRQCEEDLMQLLEQMQSQGLVQVA